MKTIGIPSKDIGLGPLDNVDLEATTKIVKDKFDAVIKDISNQFSETHVNSVQKAFERLVIQVNQDLSTIISCITVVFLSKFSIFVQDKYIKFD